MQFEISHEFDIPLDALELAVLSPGLFQQLARRLTNMESVEQREHVLTEGKLERVWSFRAKVNLPAFAQKHVTPDMLSWDEKATYDIQKHQAVWTIRLKPEWQKHFEASGTYTLTALGAGRTRRTIAGHLELKVPTMIQKIAEPLIFGEVRKTFEAEADTLRELATLV